MAEWFWAGVYIAAGVVGFLGTIALAIALLYGLACGVAIAVLWIGEKVRRG